MSKGFPATSLSAGIVLGALLASAWFLGGVGFPASSTSYSSSATTTLPAASASGAVSVQNQPPGEGVTVESVTVPPPGVWVAVREVNGTDLGNVLGAARVGGPRSNFTVPLLRATEPGHTYAVELYREDGSGSFDVANDSVYVDFDTGQRVVAYFTTTQ